MFGRKWPEGDSLRAHLRTVEGRPLLCEDEVVAGSSGSGNATGEVGALHEDMVPRPSDGLPVALLAKRGGCTFYEKSVVASAWDAVDFLIVYDNDDSKLAGLVPMSSEYPSDLSLLFVTYSSGIGECGRPFST